MATLTFPVTVLPVATPLAVSFPRIHPYLYVQAFPTTPAAPNTLPAFLWGGLTPA